MDIAHFIRLGTITATLASSWCACGAPGLSPAGVTLRYDAASRTVDVSYELQNESAVVTAAFFRKGVRIPASDCWALAGDVNKSVATGPHSFRWTPEMSDDVATFAANELSVKLTLWPAGNEPPYLVTELSGAVGTAYYASVDDIPGGVTNDVYKTDKLVLRRIPAAQQSFTMGSPGGETGRNGDEAQHTVSFSADFWIGVYPVTQRQLTLVKGTPGDSTFTNAVDSGLRPADHCSFTAARGQSAGPTGTDAPTSGSWIGLFRTNTGLTLDLPTEAQWEYACRAGSSAAFWTNITAIAWYNDEKETHPVGLKLPNAWGLYDMQGNVRECTLDWYTYTPPSGQDPYTGSGGDIVYRSGGFDQPESDCRVARRCWVGWSNTDAHNGFRVAIRSYVPSGVEPVVCEGTLADAADAFTRGSVASVGYGSDAEPFDSRFRTWFESEGANFDPSAAPGFLLLFR